MRRRRLVSSRRGGSGHIHVARLRDGSYPYDPSQRSAMGSVTNVGRTAGALWAWRSLGMTQDDAFRESERYVLGRLGDVAEGHGSPCLNVLYGALALHAAGPDQFLLFREEHEPRIIAGQQESGVLDCICRGDGFGVTCDSDSPFGDAVPGLARGRDAFATAKHALVLLLPPGGLRIVKRAPRKEPAPAVTPSER